MTSVPNPASRVKPELRETAGDRDLFLAVLRAASIRSRLITNQLDVIGTALKQRAVSIEDAMTWARDEGIIDLLDFGPPSKTEGAR